MNELKDPTCSDCKAFYKEARDENGIVRGLCMKRRELGEIPAGLEYCAHFVVKDSRAAFVNSVLKKVATKRAGSKRARTVVPEGPKRATMPEPVIGDTEGDISMDRDGLKQVLRELLEEETMYGYPQMATKWQGGSIVLQPASDENQPKAFPIDSLYHKIVMIRDRLRVLEAKLNGNTQLEDGDKVELQSYISKCYGTLTSFNVLFQDKENHFRSK